MNPAVGGNYTAVDNGDGTFEIRDIPVFAKVPAGAKRNEKEIGEEWMRAALERNHMRVKEGHLPPVHIYHSDEVAVKPKYAGKFYLTRLGSITYEGEAIPALFANIVDIPGGIFENIKKRFLPYRSVEVHDWNEPEIDSLALMPTDVPFFRMPMTTVGRVVRKNTEMFLHRGKPSPSLYFREFGPRGAMILFKFDSGEIKMSKVAAAETKELFKKSAKLQETEAAEIPDKADVTTKGDGSKVGPSSGTNTGKLEDGAEFVIEGTAPGGDDEAQVKMEDGEDGDEGGELDDDGGDGFAELKATLAEISQGLKLLLQKAGVKSEPQVAPPDAPSKDLAPVSGMKSKGGNMEKTVLKAIGPLMAEMMTLKKKVGEAEKEKKLVLTLDKVREDLAGYDIDDETMNYFRRCAASGDSFLKEAVNMFKRNVLPEPPSDAEEFEAMLAAGPEGDVVNSFAAKHPGPRAAEWIRAKAAEHANWCKLTNSDIPLDKWLETNWKYDMDSVNKA